MAKTVVVSREKLKEALKNKGMTLQKAADHLGITDTTISNALAGKPVLYNTFKLMCFGLDIEESELIAGGEPANVTGTTGLENILLEQNKMLSEMLNIMREMQKTINLVKLDVATMRFGSEKDRETLGYIHKNVGEVAKIWSESNGNS